MKLTIASYRAYLNDNPKRYWFRRKLYGWGWTPATWQGWLVLLGFVLLMLLNGYRLGMTASPDDGTVSNFVLEIVGLSLLLIVICWQKGEPPKWQWGLPDKSHHD